MSLFNDAFRDEAQRHRVCRALMTAGGLLRLWSRCGPTKEARALADAGAPDLSPGDRAFLLAACALWSGEATPLRFDELVGVPEVEPILKLALASLYGPRAIDVWLSRPTHEEGYVSSQNDVHTRAARLFDEARSVFAENNEEAMNMESPADACALGALQMASYLLMDGHPRVADKKRPARAEQLTVKMFETFASVAHARSKGAQI